MSSVNKVIILGNLGQDPDMRMTQSGQHVANISIATTDKIKKQDGTYQEKTEWHRCVAWGKTAELAGKYLNKGRKVYIEGKLQTRSWEDQSGQKKYTTEIVVQNMVFIDSGNRQGQPNGYQNNGSQNQGVPFPEEDVPF